MFLWSGVCASYAGLLSRFKVVILMCITIHDWFDIEYDFYTEFYLIFCDLVCRFFFLPMVQQVHIQPVVTTVNNINRPTTTPATMGATIFKGTVCTVAVSNLSELGDGYALVITCTVVGFVEWVVIVVGVHTDLVYTSFAHDRTVTVLVYRTNPIVLISDGHSGQVQVIPLVLSLRDSVAAWRLYLLVHIGNPIATKWNLIFSWKRSSVTYIPSQSIPRSLLQAVLLLLAVWLHSPFWHLKNIVTFVSNVTVQLISCSLLRTVCLPLDDSLHLDEDPLEALSKLWDVSKILYTPLQSSM